MEDLLYPLIGRVGGRAKRDPSGERGDELDGTTNHLAMGRLFPLWNFNGGWNRAVSVAQKWMEQVDGREGSRKPGMTKAVNVVADKEGRLAQIQIPRPLTAA